MAYATVTDIGNRIGRTLSEQEAGMCTTSLDDAAVIIDSFNAFANRDTKKAVSCRMVIRTLDTTSDIPLGASQGSMAGLGYSQSWTIGNGGGAGELYLSKLEKKLLGTGNAIGAYSPVQELAGSSS